MARIDSLSIELQTSAEAKDKLAEEYGKVIENIEANTVSALLKNRDLSGDPNSGTMEAKRFANAELADYGDARSAGKGETVKALPVVVALDTDKEMIEEVEEKDIQTYGVTGIISRRVSNQSASLRRALERAFFTEAVNEGTELELTETEAPKQLEEAIQTIQTTKNDFVDGVERDLINVVARPSFYGKVRNYLDAGNANIKTNIAEFGQYHGVNVFSSVYLPEGIDFVIMVNGSVAQPVKLSIYNPEKVQLSDATAFGTFVYYGTKAVTPDLIAYKSAETSL